MTERVRAVDPELQLAIRRIFFDAAQDAIGSAVQTGQSGIPKKPDNVRWSTTADEPNLATTSESVRQLMADERDEIAASVHRARMAFLQKAFAAYELFRFDRQTATSIGGAQGARLEYVYEQLAPLAAIVEERVGTPDIVQAADAAVPAEANLRGSVATFEIDVFTPPQDIQQYYRYTNLRAGLGETTSTRDHRIIADHVHEARAAAAVLTLLESLSRQTSSDRYGSLNEDVPPDETFQMLMAPATVTKWIGLSCRSPEALVSWLDRGVALAAADGRYQGDDKVTRFETEVLLPATEFRAHGTWADTSRVSAETTNAQDLPDPTDTTGIDSIDNTGQPCVRKPPRRTGAVASLAPPTEPSPGPQSQPPSLLGSQGTDYQRPLEGIDPGDASESPTVHDTDGPSTEPPRLAM